MVQEKRDTTPLTRLILFIICLAIAGSIVAGNQYLSETRNNDGNAPPLNSATGSIQIWSTPGNAYVEVQPANGGMGYAGWSGNTGSYHVTDLPANAYYTVTVSKDGFQPATKTIYVNPNRVAEWHPSLTSDTPDPGEIRGEVTPYGGTICIDGDQCEKYSPVDPGAYLSFHYTDLDGNEDHVLTITTPGYAPYSQTVYVAAGASVDLGIIQLQRQ